MTAPSANRRATGFFVGFLVVPLLIAGGLSYFASSDPDGLDTVALEGCAVVEAGDDEQGGGSDPPWLDRPSVPDRGPVRRAGGAAAVHRSRAERGVPRAHALRTRAARRLEHPDQGHGATARGVGSLFVRSYERGERVHLAMLSRGWVGEMPRLSDAVTTRRHWLAGLAPVGVAVALAVTGWVITS